MTCRATARGILHVVERRLTSARPRVPRGQRTCGNLADPRAPSLSLASQPPPTSPPAGRSQRAERRRPAFAPSPRRMSLLVVLDHVHGRFLIAGPAPSTATSRATDRPRCRRTTPSSSPHRRLAQSGRRRAAARRDPRRRVIVALGGRDFLVLVLVVVGRPGRPAPPRPVAGPGARRPPAPARWCPSASRPTSARGARPRGPADRPRGRRPACRRRPTSRNPRGPPTRVGFRTACRRSSPWRSAGLGALT